MDNKQATETLRAVVAAIPKFENIDIPIADVVEAIGRGADASEMLEWLLDRKMIVLSMYHAWLLDPCDGTFLAFCEARFRERAR